MKRCFMVTALIFAFVFENTSRAATVSADQELLRLAGYGMQAWPFFNIDVTCTTFYKKTPAGILEQAKKDGVTLSDALRVHIITSSENYQFDEFHQQGGQDFKQLMRTRRSGTEMMVANMSDKSVLVSQMIDNKFAGSPLYCADWIFWKSVAPLAGAEKIVKIENTRQEIVIHFVESGTNGILTLKTNMPAGKGDRETMRVSSIVYFLANGAREQIVYEMNPDTAGKHPPDTLSFPARSEVSVIDGKGNVTERQLVDFEVAYANDINAGRSGEATLSAPIIAGKFSVTDKRIPGKEVRYLCIGALPPLSVAQQMLLDRKFNVSWNEAMESAGNQ